MAVNFEAFACSLAGKASIACAERAGKITSLGEGPHRASPSLNHAALHASAGSSAGARSGQTSPDVRGRASGAKAVVGTEASRISSSKEIFRMCLTSSCFPMAFTTCCIDVFAQNGFVNVSSIDQ